MSPPKVLFLGLDAASGDLVSQWSAEGLLPTFRSLFETASWGTTINAPGLYTGSVWPSLWTGVTPGRHGCYYGEQLKPGTYEVDTFLGHDIKREPFWNTLSRAGRRIALFDIPKAPLCEGLNGLQIVDWGTHDADVLPCSWPSGLIDDVHQRHGASPFRRCDWIMRRADPERQLRDMLLWRIDRKVAIVEDILGREAWDLGMFVFGDSHCVGHQCWHLHDPSHPHHDPELAATIGDPLRDVYSALDSALARLLQLAGSETTVFVFLSHGMAAHYDATHLLDDVLRRLEGHRRSSVRTVLDRVRPAWQLLPLRFTESLQTLAQLVDRFPDASDRRGRLCFAVPTNANAGGIRLNLIGREPNGQLSPGAEADEFCQKLIADLHELVDPDSGRPLVREVLDREDSFPGEHSNLLPDLVVRWNREHLITAVASPKIGRIEREDVSTRRTGDHRPEGLFLVRGPGIEPGVHLAPARVEDFAPTMAALLGVELQQVDGCVISPTLQP